MHILIFEDNIYKYNDICKAIKSGNLGIVEIDCAKNLELGTKKIKKKIANNETIDLIITDMWYPKYSGGEEENSGEELINFIKENEWKIPIILCSSVKYQIPEIHGTVHYSENIDWETELIKLIKQILKRRLSSNVDGEVHKGLRGNIHM